MFDSHMHTPLCRHAVGAPDEYAAAAVSRGLRGIIFTCHNPLPRGLSRSVRMDPEEFEAYLQLVSDAKEQWEGRLEVRLGLECDYLPGEGLEGWLAEQAAAVEYDYLLASVHPHLPEYRKRFWRDQPVDFQQRYFEHLAEAAELRLHDALAHPDLVKNVSPNDWDVSRILDDIRRSLDRIAAAGMAMELNTSGWKKNVKEQNPGATILREIAQRGIAIVLGSDSHEPGRVGDRFLDALTLVEEAGFTHVSYFQRRRRTDVPIAEARSVLIDNQQREGIHS